jgi:hypothetical protein
MRDMFGTIGISVATNTALFTGLDLGQWVADTLSLWALPANLVAAVIVTGFGLALAVLGRALRASGTAGSATDPTNVAPEMDGAAPSATALMPVTFRRSLPVYPRAARR